MTSREKKKGENDFNILRDYDLDMFKICKFIVKVLMKKKSKC